MVVLSGKRQPLAGHRQQVGSYHRCQNVALKRTKPLPGAARKAKAAFEPGYTGFDSGTKSPESFIYVITAAHVFLLQAALFGKTNVLDISLLGFGQVIFGGETAVQGDF